VDETLRAWEDFDAARFRAFRRAVLATLTRRARGLAPMDAARAEILAGYDCDRLGERTGGQIAGIRAERHYQHDRVGDERSQQAVAGDRGDEHAQRREGEGGHQHDHRDRAELVPRNAAEHHHQREQWDARGHHQHNVARRRHQLAEDHRQRADGRAHDQWQRARLALAGNAAAGGAGHDQRREHDSPQRHHQEEDDAALGNQDAIDRWRLVGRARHRDRRRRHWPHHVRDDPKRRQRKAAKHQDDCAQKKVRRAPPHPHPHLLD